MNMNAKTLIIVFAAMCCGCNAAAVDEKTSDTILLQTYDQLSGIAEKSSESKEQIDLYIELYDYLDQLPAVSSTDYAVLRNDGFDLTEDGVLVFGDTSISFEKYF